MILLSPETAAGKSKMVAEVLGLPRISLFGAHTNSRGSVLGNPREARRANLPLLEMLKSRRKLVRNLHLIFRIRFPVVILSSSF